MTRPANIDIPLIQFDSPPNLVEGISTEERIRGNAPDKIKFLSAATFWHFVDAKGTSYGADTGRKLKFAEINIFNSTETRGTRWMEIPGKLRDGLTVETVFEVVVDQGMHRHRL
jgi:acyl-coenzyme A thioesterase 13